MPLTSGTDFAGFRILRQLGSGGMGEVYLAQHPRLPRQEALKVLPRALSADAVFRERFSREADLAAKLYHPHIVGVHDRGEFDEQLWISMDFIDGTDAARLLEHYHPYGMPLPEVLEIVGAVADALDYAHANAMLHRDVKPANILLTRPERGRRRILLADFGIARSLTEVSRLTQTNMAIGTVNYVAPEQLTDASVDGRADQYGLAATTYHLLTGTVPFDHSNPAVVISSHLTAPPPSLAERRPDLAALDHVLAAGMAKDPADRFRSCEAFVRALSAPPAPGHPPPPPVHAAPVRRGSTAMLPTPPPAAAPPTSSPPGPAAAPKSKSRLPAAVTVLAVLLLAAVAFVVVTLDPWGQDTAATPRLTPTSTAPTTSSTTGDAGFEGMRDFVIDYYALLPANADEAWTRLDPNYQATTNLRDYRDFWSGIRSVAISDVSPSSDTSVTARVSYTLAGGGTDTERRSFEISSDGGQMRIYDSQRIGG